MSGNAVLTARFGVFMIRIAVVWCLGFGFYLLFAGTVSADELATAAVLASFATAWAALIRNAAAPVRFAVFRQLFAAGLRAVFGLVPATVRTWGTLLRAAVSGRSPSRATVADFRYGVEDDPRERSRRALAVLGASLAPDRFVVRVDPERSRVLLHDFGHPNRVPDAGWLQ